MQESILLISESNICFIDLKASFFFDGIFFFLIELKATFVRKEPKIETPVQSIRKRVNCYQVSTEPIKPLSYGCKSFFRIMQMHSFNRYETVIMMNNQFIIKPKINQTKGM